MKYTDALFVDGVFRPTKPIELESGTRVRLGFVNGSRPAMESDGAHHRLSYLQQKVLDEVHLHSLKELAEIVESVSMSVRFDKMSVTPTQVGSALRSLMEKGYVEMALPPEAPDIYRVTPKGKVTEVHRRRAWWAARKGKLQTLSPMPEYIGPSFEDLNVSLLDLPKSIHNALKRNGILTVGDLIRLTEKEFLQLPRLAKKSLEAIEEELWSMGLRLRKKGNLRLRKKGNLRLRKKGTRAMKPTPKPEGPSGNPPSIELQSTPLDPPRGTLQSTPLDPPTGTLQSTPLDPPTGTLQSSDLG